MNRLLALMRWRNQCEISLRYRARRKRRAEIH